MASQQPIESTSTDACNIDDVVLTSEEETPQASSSSSCPIAVTKRKGKSADEEELQIPVKVRGKFNYDLPPLPKDSPVQGIVMWKTKESGIRFDYEVVDYFILSKDEMPTALDKDWHIMNVFTDGEGEAPEPEDAPFVHLHLCTPKRCKMIEFKGKDECQHAFNIKKNHAEHLVRRHFSAQR